MFYPDLNRDQLEQTDYGRGRFIRGARFVVFTTEGGPSPAHSLSTHRTEAAAIRALRRWAQHTGRVHYGMLE